MEANEAAIQLAILADDFLELTDVLRRIPPFTTSNLSRCSWSGTRFYHKPMQDEFLTYCTKLGVNHPDLESLYYKRTLRTWQIEDAARERRYTRKAA